MGKWHLSSWRERHKSGRFLVVWFFFPLNDKVSIRVEEQLAGILLIGKLKMAAAVVYSTDLKSCGASRLRAGNSPSKVASSCVMGAWSITSVILLLPKDLMEKECLRRFTLAFLV